MTARRAAASRAKPHDEVHEDLRRSGRRRLWRLVGLLAVLGVLGGLGAAAYFSPLMSVRTIDVQQPDVQGGPMVPREEIVEVADVPLGTPLLQVDTAAVAGRVARIPAVESVRVDRSYPSALTIEVLERRATSLIEGPDGRIGVMDRLGVVYVEFASRAAMGDAAAGKRVYRTLPVLEVPNPGPQDPTTRAVLDTLQSLPDWLRPQVTSATASSPADIKLHLSRERTVVWGDSGRPVDKAEALAHVITLRGTTFNVSSPEYPAVS
ncbi:cell division protein FtsQ/DivIB [Gordonia iterans]